MRAELGLVGRHVDIDGAIVLAACAGQAEVERLLDRAALPAVLERSAMHHLEQQVRAAARRVLLLARRQVARAHDAVLGVMPAAFADPDTAYCGPVPAALRREGEAGVEPRRTVIGAEAEIGGDRIGIDDLARVHPAVRVPDRLKLAERRDQLRTVHLDEQFGLRLAVAMLAGDRAAKAHDEIGRLAEKTPPFRDALFGAQTEIPAAMDAAIAEMAVKRGLVTVALGECVEPTQIVAGAVGRHGGILPALPGVGMTGHKGGGAEPRLAHL